MIPEPPERREPDARDLRWFGGLLAAALAVLGGTLALPKGPGASSVALWVGAAMLFAAYYLLPPLRRPCWLAWMTLTAPLRWIAMHALLTLVFYLLVTPLGRLLRRVRTDQLGRRFDRGRTSYWQPNDSAESPLDSYFRQF